MTDKYIKGSRSFNMSRIRGKNTKPEIIVRKFLFSKGFRFRLHSESLPGKPDIVLRKYKTVIFVHGCFWHGHQGCKYATVPKTNQTFWVNKLKKNQDNDSKVCAALTALGWNIIEIWSCELKKRTIDNTFSKLLSLLEFQ